MMPLVTILLVAGAPRVSFAQTSSPDEMVWHWFGSCREGRMMTVDVTLADKRLFRSPFPICLVRRAEKQTDHQHDLHFVFRAQARLFGEEFASLGTPDIEGTVWEAGSEPDVILLGVSFMTKERILLNTIHIAGAQKTTQTELASELTMKSLVRPMSKK